MSDTARYSAYAILCEINNREFKKKLDHFPEELRFYVVLAAGIVGAENAKRMEETPQAVVKDGEEFVSKLLEIASLEDTALFREILETYLVEAMKDELRHSCSNCANFNDCLDVKNASVGLFFKRRVQGEETEELKSEIARQVAQALQRTPYVDSDKAHILCSEFRHHYSASGLGEVFRRYADIAAGLRQTFGINYKRIQQEMIVINSAFMEKGREVR
ncbi:MAG: hypothetical protein M0Z79_11660 [Nitrospiraceae bacterium]|nr:hypothetical protein [Nitrospiraceae bacterium]